MNFEKPSWCMEGYPPFKGEVGKAVVKGQVITYPKIARTIRDPGTSGFDIVSIMLLDEEASKKFGVKGFFKVRGSSKTEDGAIKEAARIAKKIDSKFSCFIAKTGDWHPISESLKYANETYVLPGSDDFECDIEDLIKRQRDIQDVNKRQKKILEESDKILKGEETVEEKKDPIDIYTQKKVSTYTLLQAKREAKSRYENAKKGLKTCFDTLAELEISDSTLKDKWLDHYNEALENVGADKSHLNEEAEKYHKKKMFKLGVPGYLEVEEKEN